MNRIWWKVIFIIIFVANIVSMYSSVTLPESLQPVHPWWVSLLLFPFKLLVLLAAYCAAFNKQPMRKESFWWGVLIGDLVINLMVYYYEFNAGGYSQSEMIDFIFVSSLMYLIFMTPLLKCVGDIRKSNKNDDNER